MTEQIAASLTLDLQAGKVEISGSQEFVKAMFAEVRPILESVPSDAKAKDGLVSKLPVPAAPTSKKISTSSSKAPAAILPVEIGDKNGISLKKFLDQKKPPQTSERLVVFFTYYLTKKAGLAAVQAGHLMYCFAQLGIKKPSNIYATIVNAKQRAKLVVTGSEPNSIVCNIAGENWVEQDLPAAAKE